VDYPDGRTVSGTFAPSDTLRPDGIVPGNYSVSLAHVGPNCTVTNGGGRHQTVLVEPPRSAVVRFSVICSDTRYAPRIEHLSGSLSGDSLSVFHAVVTDPGSPGAVPFPDIDAYHWDITDCQRRSLLKDGEIYREGLYLPGSPTRGQDTVRVSVVFRPDYAPNPPSTRCVALRFVDFDGNTTAVVERRMGTPPGSPPAVSAFNAILQGPLSDARIEFNLSATDPDGDLVGTYVQIVRTDGSVVGRGISGHPGTTVPTLPLRNTGIVPGSIREIRIFVIDREGNFTVARDADLAG